MSKPEALTHYKPIVLAYMSPSLPDCAQPFCCFAHAQSRLPYYELPKMPGRWRFFIKIQLQWLSRISCYIQFVSDGEWWEPSVGGFRGNTQGFSHLGLGKPGYLLSNRPARVMAVGLGWVGFIMSPNMPRRESSTASGSASTRVLIAFW